MIIQAKCRLYWNKLFTIKMANYIKTEKIKFAFLIKGSCTSIQYTSKEILDQLKKSC